MGAMDLDDEALAAIADLVSRSDVCSVACYYRDPQLWQIFLSEQVKRATATGLPPQVAFSLCGPDSGLPREVDPAAMGGEVYIPYEGITGGDLFIQPHWRNFHPDRANASGSLRAGNGGKDCQYLLTANDYGEIDNSRRSLIGAYFLYESTLPYRPSDPLNERERYAANALGFEPPSILKLEELRVWNDALAMQYDIDRRAQELFAVSIEQA